MVALLRMRHAWCIVLIVALMATMTVSAHADDSPPVANEDVFTVVAGTSTNMLDILANDFPDDGTLKIDYVTTTPTDTGVVLYFDPNTADMLFADVTPDAVSGMFDVGYHNVDVNGVQSNGAVITIFVEGVDPPPEEPPIEEPPTEEPPVEEPPSSDPCVDGPTAITGTAPVACDDVIGGMQYYRTTYKLNVTRNDVDPQGRALRVTSCTQPVGKPNDTGSVTIKFGIPYITIGRFATDETLRFTCTVTNGFEESTPASVVLKVDRLKPLRFPNRSRGPAVKFTNTNPVALFACVGERVRAPKRYQYGCRKVRANSSRRIVMRAHFLALYQEYGRERVIVSVESMVVGKIKKPRRKR